MAKKVCKPILFYFLILVLDIKKVNVQRTYSTSPQSIKYNKELQSRTKAPVYSEELKSLPQYNSRIRATTRPSCSKTKCNTSERRRLEAALTATTKPSSVKYQALKLSAISKSSDSTTVKNSRKPKLSRIFNPAGTEDSGFVPILKPHGSKTSQRSGQRRARHKTNEELIVKESRATPNILGNGNFEILSGGIYSDDESNEIPESRRMSRGYDSFAAPRRFQQSPFNVRNFQFPSFYQDRHQLPTHPMFFPRAAY